MWISILPISREYPQIWDDFHVPTGVNRNEIIDMINIECAELELLYTDPELLKYMIRNWCRTEFHIWDKLAQTMNMEYNPIYNLDVTWEETRTPDLTKTRTPDLKNETSPADTVTESVQGFNSSTWSDSNKTTRGGKITSTETGSDTLKETGSEKTVNRRYGNQGVTMTQDMIKAEREIDQFSIYDYILTSFKNKFCLLVY